MKKKDKMNILMISPGLDKSLGGMSTVVNNYFESEIVNEINLKHISTYKPGRLYTKVFKAISAYINIIISAIKYKIDIIHIHMASRGSFYRKSIIVILMNLLKKRVIVHLHGGGFDKFYTKESSKLAQRYIKYILNKSDLLIVLSEEWKEKIINYGIETKVEVLFNGVYLPKINLYKSKNKNITFLGRLTEEKGFFDLLKIAKVLNKDNNMKIDFNIGGSGDTEYINHLVTDYGIEENINLNGWVNSVEKDEILQNTGIFILPSYFEAMPMSILEAMSYGIPIITTNVGGIPAIIEQGINGYMREPGDIDSMVNDIKQILYNDEFRCELSKNSYYKIKQHFSMEKQNKELIKLYKSII